MIKKVITDKYAIIFNMDNGLEIMSGIKGNPDPWSLEGPSLLDVGVMGHCLNKCPICYQGNIQTPNMPIDDFKKIIDECKEFTMSVALGGRGDPNLHEDFGEILKYARENNVVPNYTTSGNNLTDEQIKLTKQYCGAVAVSDYKQDFTYSAIKRFQDIGMKTNIHYILRRDNMDEVFDILDNKDVWNGQINLEKLNAIIFLLFKPQGRGKDKLELIPTEDQLKTFIDKVRTVKRSWKTGMDSCCFGAIMKFTKLTPTEEIFADSCEAARMSSYITTDSKLIPCSFANHDFGVSIKNSSIRDVWHNSDIFNKFRDNLKARKCDCPVGF